MRKTTTHLAITLVTLLLLAGCGGSSGGSGSGVDTGSACVWDESDWDNCQWQ